MDNLNLKISHKKNLQSLQNLKNLKKTRKKELSGGFINIFSGDNKSLEEKLIESLKKQNLSIRYIKNLLEKKKININYQDSQGRTAIALCVERNSVPIFNLLKKYYPKYDIPDKDGRTPFFKACLYGNLEIVKLLIDCDIDPNKEDKHGNTPFYTACQHNHFPIIHLLSKLKKEKIINSTLEQNNSFSNIKNAIKKINFKFGEYLINFNKKNFDGDTPAHVTSKKGFENIMIILANIFDINGNPQVFLNEQNKLGETPCFLAAKHGQPKIMKVFINLNTINKKKRVNFDKQDYEGYSPCYVAAERGHKNIITELSLINLDMNTPESGYGQTPCFGACKQGHEKVLIELIKHGANIHLATPKATGSFSPLFISLLNGHIHIAKILLLNGYFPRFKDFSSTNKGYIKKLLSWSQKQEELDKTVSQLIKIDEFYQ